MSKLGHLTAHCVFRQVARNVVKSRLPGANRAPTAALSFQTESNKAPRLRHHVPPTRLGCSGRSNRSAPRRALLPVDTFQLLMRSGMDRDQACGDHLRRDDLTLHGSLMSVAIVIDLGGVPILKDAPVLSKGWD